MEDFTSYFQKLVKSPAGSFSSELNISNNNMELLNNNYSHHHVPNDHQPDHLGTHLYGVVEDYSTAPDQFSLAGNGLFFPFDQGKTDPFVQSLSSIAQGVDGSHKNIVSEFSEIPTSPGFNNGSDKHVGASARKRRRKNEGQVEIKPREVVHVRAKRGHATDSHSLAERVRRERINEKLKVLQDLVPGCYKTMGMAVMLDVIINYVRSLQNQIEFLSMKLSAASLFYDFNSPEAEALETLQRTANAFEAHGMNRTAADQGCNVGMRPRNQ